MKVRYSSSPSPHSGLCVTELSGLRSVAQKMSVGKKERGSVRLAPKRMEILGEADGLTNLMALDEVV